MVSEIHFLKMMKKKKKRKKKKKWKELYFRSFLRYGLESGRKVSS